MTVQNTKAKAGPYAGAGTKGPFPVDFRFLSDSHLRVIKTDSDGVMQTLVLGADYTVLGALAPNGGSVTLTANLPVGYTLVILRNIPATQLADYVENDKFPAQSHEDALDKLTMLVQQQGELTSRALVAPPSDAVVSLELPSAAARARRYLSFDEEGRPVSTTFDIDEVARLSQEAISAASRAAESEQHAGESADAAEERADFVSRTVDGVTPTVARFSGDADTAEFTLPSFPSAEENTQVYISGVYQQKDTYSVDGDKLIFDTPPPAGTDNIEVNIAPHVALAIGVASSISINVDGEVQSLDAYVKETRAGVEDNKSDIDELEKNTTRLNNYTDLRAYSGQASIVDLTSPNIAGRFSVISGDASSLDNGGTLIVGADGRRWARSAGLRVASLSWFEQSAFHDRVNAAVQWLANSGGGEVLLDAAYYLQTGTITMLPNVRIRGLGIDKTRIDFTINGVAFDSSKLGSVGHRDSGLSHFLLNSTLGKVGGAIGVRWGNSTYCRIDRVQVANFTIGLQFPMSVDGGLGESYFNKVEQCWFASCKHAVWFSGAANRNTFDTNVYSSCDVAYNFSEAGNVSETNTFINENIEGCRSWAEWPIGQIFSQTWIGCTIENPSSNGYVCSVKDPGRQVFVNLALIPSRNTAALDFYAIRDTPSSLFGSLASSEALGFNTRIEEELALYGGLRMRSLVGVAPYSATIPAGTSGVTTAVVAGAAVGDMVIATSDKDLAGCVLVPWVSSADVVTIRLQNASGGNVELIGITIKVFCVKSDL